MKRQISPLLLIVLSILSFSVYMAAIVSPLHAETLTITKGSTSITTDDGIRKLVSKDDDVAMGKEFYHDLINNGNTNLVYDDGDCGEQNANLMGFWDCQTPTTFQLLEATPTRAKITSSDSTYGGLDWVTYPDGRSFVHMYSVGEHYFNIAHEWSSSIYQVRTIDRTAYTFLLSDTTNLNYAGFIGIPFTLTDISGSSGWFDENSVGYGWANRSAVPGDVLVDLSVFRATSQDVADRRDDYRNPEPLSAGLTVGEGWYDDNEYTEFPSDYFNEREGAYLLDAEGSRADFTMNAGRYDPAFKIRNWRTQDDPDRFLVGGDELENGTDYNADILPFSEGWFMDSSSEMRTQLADAGLDSSLNEYLNDDTKNYLIPFEEGQALDYIAFGSTSKFRGINIDLSRNGVGDAEVVWEYWSGSSWSALTVSETYAGVQNFTNPGTIYWESDPESWEAVCLVTGFRSLYYVRARLVSGSFSTLPIERRVTTDILLAQLLDVIAGNGTEISLYAMGDAVEPEVELDALLNDASPTQTPEFSGTATDDQSSIASVEFRIDDDETWTDCTADDGTFDSLSEGFTCTLGENLPNGQHAIYVRATDSMGNTTTGGGIFSYEFMVHTQGAPYGSIVINDGDSYTVSTTVALTLHVVDDIDDESDITMVVCDNDDLTGCSSEAYRSEMAWEVSEGMGDKHVYVRFTDTDGNVSPVYVDSIVYVEANMEMQTQLVSMETVPLPETGGTGGTEEGERIYDVKVKITNALRKPLEYATIILFSDPKVAVTDANGIANFDYVEKGLHTILIVYKDGVGTQQVQLEEEVKGYDLTISLTTGSLFDNSFINVVVTANLVLTTAILTFLVIKNVNKKIVRKGMKGIKSGLSSVRKKAGRQFKKVRSSSGKEN